MIELSRSRGRGGAGQHESFFLGSLVESCAAWAPASSA